MERKETGEEAYWWCLSLIRRMEISTWASLETCERLNLMYNTGWEFRVYNILN